MRTFTNRVKKWVTIALVQSLTFGIVMPSFARTQRFPWECMDYQSNHLRERALFNQPSKTEILVNELVNKARAITNKMAFKAMMAQYQSDLKGRGMRSSHLHIGHPTNILRMLNRNNPTHKMPRFEHILKRVYILSAKKESHHTGYSGNVFDDTLADYIEIYSERWPVRERILSLDPRRIEFLKTLHDLFIKELPNHPTLNITKITPQARLGKNLIGLDSAWNIDTALGIDFIPKRVREYRNDNVSARFPFSNPTNEFLLILDLDIIDKFISVEEQDEDTASRAKLAIVLRELKLQELYQEGLNLDEASNDPRIAEIQGHDELLSFLWQVLNEKLERETSPQADFETANSLEDRIDETSAYLKLYASDSSLESYKSLVRLVEEGELPVEILEILYDLRSIFNLGKFVDRLYKSFLEGPIDVKILAHLYRAYELQQKGIKVIALEQDLSGVTIPILALKTEEFAIKFLFYTFDDKPNEMAILKNRLSALLERISQDKEFSRKLELLLYNEIDPYDAKLFRLLETGKLKDNRIFIPNIIDLSAEFITLPKMSPGKGQDVSANDLLSILFQSERTQRDMPEEPGKNFSFTFWIPFLATLISSTQALAMEGTHTFLTFTPGVEFLIFPIAFVIQMIRAKVTPSKKTAATESASAYDLPNKIKTLLGKEAPVPAAEIQEPTDVILTNAKDLIEEPQKLTEGLHSMLKRIGDPDTKVELFIVIESPKIREEVEEIIRDGRVESEANIRYLPHPTNKDGSYDLEELLTKNESFLKGNNSLWIIDHNGHWAGRVEEILRRALRPGFELISTKIQGIKVIALSQ